MVSAGADNAEPADVRISGFMIVRDVVRQGYPFLEAIRSVLPVCSEFLVSDGCSEDGTWRALEQLRDSYPGKVRLFRDAWRGPTAQGEVIATMTNVLLERCTSPYCLNVQANEIFPEETARDVAQLPELFPGYDCFELPFYSIMGSDLPYSVDFRCRLFRNRPYIRSRGDGFDCGYVRSYFLWRLRPREFLARVVRQVGVRTWYTARPVYRYRALFPVNYVRKLDTHQILYTRAAAAGPSRELACARQALVDAQAAPDPVRAFWEHMAQFFKKERFRGPAPSARDEIPRSGLRQLGDAPAVVRPLLGRWQYDLRWSLEALGRLN
jgi:hypothetical protein